METISYDDLGPAKILNIYCPQVPFHAVVVVDNTALGPAIGGVRVSPTVDAHEVQRLARTMTLKSSIAGLPHGGGKAGIMVDPSRPDMERIFRIFARMMSELTEYIPAPDMGCHEKAMTWVKDEIGRVLGLPEEIGGLPLDKLGATGYGVAECAEIAAEYAGVKLPGSRVAIQGYGSVGTAAARFLAEKGATIVAVSDSKGAIFDSGGLRVDKLQAVKEETGRVTNYPGGRVMDGGEIFGVPCDILVPAATPDVINQSNCGRIEAKIILEGANIPTTQEAEKILASKGVLVVPDFIANAGGLIMAAMEYQEKTADEAFIHIATRIKTNAKKILEKAHCEKMLPRAAAELLAYERVRAAMPYREYTYPIRH